MSNVSTINESFFEKYKNEFTVALGSMIISFSPIFARITDVPPSVKGVYRMLFAGIYILGYAILTRRRITPPKSVIVLMVLCGTWIGFDISFWHQSIQRVGPGLATVLGNCQVFLLIAIGIVIYKEQVRKQFYLSIPIAALGLFLLVGHKWGALTLTYKIGVAQGLATALFYALYTMTLKKTMAPKDRLDSFTNLGWVSIFSAISLSLVALYLGESFRIPDMRNFEYLICYALVCQVLGWALISRGLSEINLSTAGFLILLQPGLAFIWDVLFFHRPTPMIEVLGVVITFTSIYVGVTSQKKK